MLNLDKMRGFMANFFKFVVAATFAVIGLTAHAAKAPVEYEEDKMSAPPPFTSNYSTEVFKKLVKKMQAKGDRAVAEENQGGAQVDDIDEKTAVSQQFRDIRDAFIGNEERSKTDKKYKGASKSEEINALLEELDKNFKANKYTEPDAQLLAAQLLILKPMRGIIYRGRHIFDTSEGQAKLSRMGAIIALRTTASGLDVYLPTEQWKAGFDYAIAPFYAPKAARVDCTMDSSWNDHCEMDSGSKFERWLRVEVLPRVLALNAVLVGLEGKTVYADNQIYYGKANFVSSKDRLVKLGEAERLAMLAGTQATLSALYGVSAFSLDGLFKAIDDVGELYGFAAFFNADQATAKKRFEKIAAHRNLFRFKRAESSVAKAYLNYSYESLKAAMKNAYLSWQFLENHQNEKEYYNNLLDPRIVAPFNRVLTTGFNNGLASVGIDKNFNEVSTGEVVSAVVQGEKVTVKLKEFFTNPPESLQNFRPVAFDEDSTPKSKTIGGETVNYRNYYYGRPTGWDYSIYNKYFPGVKSADDVKRTARVLSQSWGGFLLGLPLSMVMM